MIDLSKAGWGRGGVSRKFVCLPCVTFPELPFKFFHFVGVLIMKLKWYQSETLNKIVAIKFIIMILGIYFALCIQGSQRVLQLGFCYFQGYSWVGHTSQEAAAHSFPLDQVGSIIRLRDWDCDHTTCINTPTTHKDPQTSDIYMLKGKRDKKIFGPKHNFTCISRVKPWNGTRFTFW